MVSTVRGKLLRTALVLFVCPLMRESPGLSKAADEAVDL